MRSASGEWLNVQSLDPRQARLAFWYLKYQAVAPAIN
jgi:hypothetical protein